MKKSMLSAIQPTNAITLGNYLGAVRNWVTLQEQYEGKFFLVDLHALTVRQDPKTFAEQNYFALAVLIGAGLDPDKNLIFVQSHVPQHAELNWILNCFTHMGELNRMTQFKDKSAKAGKNIPTGLFTYPVLMAADILLYDTHVVPVGDDQKQHLELTRDVAMRMNNVYGDDLFVVPEPHILGPGARVMSLQDPDSKMSKSDPSPNASIFFSDTPKKISQKIKRATTDSGSEVTYEDSKPGVKNLINIQAAITGKSPKDIATSYAGKQYGHLKVETADIVVEELRPIQERSQELMADRAYLDQVLKRGATMAREQAQAKMDKIYGKLGLVPQT